MLTSGCLVKMYSLVEATIVLAVMQLDEWCVVTEQMVVSILSISLDLSVMSWPEAELALALLCGDLNPDFSEALPSDMGLQKI